MYFLGIDSFTKQIFDILRYLLFAISSFFCDVIIYAYDIFIRLSKAQFLTSSQIQDIYSRVTLILGIFMLFKLMFSFIQYLINPETMSDKSKGASKLIIKSIVVIAVLGITPFAFQQAYKLQNLILDSNFLAKIIFATDTDSSVSEFGTDLVSTLFLSMYSINDGELCDNIGNDLSLIEEEIKYNHSYTLARDCLNEAASDSGFRHTYEEGYVVNFQWNGLGLVVVSGITAYIILSYCLSIGMRVIQLAFLQLISPIPIMSYLGEDKDGAFSKWLKRCLSTFLDLFIRLGIIYFVVYIIGLLMSDSSSYYLLLSTTGNPTGFLKTLILLVLIIGLLLFAKKAPDLLKELLPQGIGNNIGFGLDFAKNMKTVKDTVNSAKNAIAPGYRAVGRVAGAGIGGFTGAAVSTASRLKTNKDAKNGFGKTFAGAAGGFVSGFASGVFTGSKKGNMIKNVGTVVKDRKAADNQYDELINTGGSIIGRSVAKVQDTFGRSRGQVDKRKLDYGNLVKQSVDNIEKLAESTSGYKQLEHSKQHLDIREGESREMYERRISLHNTREDNFKEAYINAALKGEKQFTYRFSDIDKVVEKVKIGTRMVESTTEFEDVFEDREVSTGVLDKFGKEITRIEKVKVGQKPKMVEEDVYEDRVVFKEVEHEATYDLTNGDQAKATQVNTEVVNLRNEVETKNITFTDEKGNEELVKVPKDAKGILDLTKAVRRNEAAIKGAEGYMAGQANMPKDKK